MLATSAFARAAATSRETSANTGHIFERRLRLVYARPEGPRLACRWQLGRDGRLACVWQFEDRPVPSSTSFNP